MRRSLLSLALLVLSALPALAEEVSVEGCVVPGVEVSCLMLRAGNAIYNIGAAEPRPEVGTYGRVTGTVKNAFTTCMQGTVLSPARWEPVEGKACPAPQQ